MFGRIALIAVTGYARPEDIASGREAGFDTYVAKPLTIERLEKAIEEASVYAAQRLGRG
jgi:CheY-like chemotaxis protein